MTEVIEFIQDLIEALRKKSIFVIEWMYGRMNERMNKRMNEWMNERMNERMNELMNEWNEGIGMIELDE